MGTVAIRPEDYQNFAIGKELVRGLEIELSLSAYDLPREVEGKLDKSTGVFHIFFKYLDQEEAIPKKLDDEITLKVGKNSGKILGLEIQVHKRGVHQIALQIKKAVQSEIPNLRKFNQRANYEVVSSVLDHKRDSIFSESALAG